jgi:hypothetical protein
MRRSLVVLVVLAGLMGAVGSAATANDADSSGAVAASPSATPTPILPRVSLVEAAPGDESGGVSTGVWVLLAVGASLLGFGLIGFVFYRLL